MARPRKEQAPVTVERLTPEERLIAAVFVDSIETDPEAASLKRERARAAEAEKAAAQAYKASCTVEIESLHKGGTLFLGDGRRLAFGEKAFVTSELAETLIGRKQAK